jgi:dTDP-4-amino-4,6-dideoxygalactose transaminase
VAPESFNTHAAAIADLITPRTRAVVVAHIGGEPVDMEPVVDLTRRHGLYLIEDCAQSHGAVYADTAVGTFGHIAAFSTMSGKHHCTGAQGGIVFTRDPELAGRARRFADRGKPFDLPGAAGNVRAGLNCNQNELAAAIGSVQLSRLPGILDRRRRVATTIRDALADAGPVCVGREPPSSVCSYWFLRMRFRAEAVRVSKAEYCRALAAEGIPVVPDYQAIPALFPWFRDRAVLGTAGFPWTCAEYTGSRTPVAHTDEACRSVARHFHLPIHEGYGDPEIEDILTAIRKLNHALGA